jgi:hypothetical protein
MWMLVASSAVLTFSVEPFAGVGDLEILGPSSWDTKGPERRNQGGAAKHNILILLLHSLVEMKGFEPSTSALRKQHSAQ